MKPIIYTLICICLFACKKSKFLDEKPDQSLVIPTSLEDLQALLDNDSYMNGASGSGLSPALGEMGSDNFWVRDIEYETISPFSQRAYTWAKDIYPSELVYDWNLPYRCVFYSNIAIEGLSKLSKSKGEEQAWNNIYGSALFHRSHMFYQLAQVFAPPYKESSSSTDLGIPLRIKSDINETITRSSVRDTYERIVEDLKLAVDYLPMTPLYPIRPSRPAAYALLARTLLSMNKYHEALLYADSCLMYKSTLMDYNQIPNVNLPFPRFNAEIIFPCNLIQTELLNVTIAKIDTLLYNSYNSNDLRKTRYFRTIAGGFRFKGTYAGSAPNDLFGGIATDEVYLIRAECYAREDKLDLAINDLNTLMITRWSNNGSFVPYSATTKEEALNLILAERRKELVFRGLRWTDLRRLNVENPNSNPLKRFIKGATYSLPPNDKKYVYAFPDEVIGFNPGMQQNPR